MTQQEIYTRIENASSDLWVVATYAAEIKDDTKVMHLVAEQLKQICHMMDNLASIIE